MQPKFRDLFSFPGTGMILMRYHWMIQNVFTMFLPVAEFSFQHSPNKRNTTPANVFVYLRIKGSEFFTYFRISISILDL